VGSISVVVLGDPAIAAELGKKSTASDITLYHQVQDGHALSVIVPNQYPEKFASLLSAIALADRALLVVTQLDRTVAESAATVDLFDIPVTVRLGPQVGVDEARKAFRGLRFAADPFEPLDVKQLRDELGGWNVPARPGPVAVRVDHAFPVKGVGTVALGFVVRGTLQIHDSLQLLPTETVVEVRSIQVHDVDVKNATTGERVGVALKGIEADIVSRGQTLCPAGSLLVSDQLSASGFRRCQYYRGPIAAGTRLHGCVGAQLVPVKVESVEGDRIVLHSDKPVAYSAGDAIVLSEYSPVAGPRCAARAVLGAITRTS
jgi:selenocysteine-specific translation elongation factor